MSVFCSKTLIFAPECWKCILKGLDFENFLRNMLLECPRKQKQSFFPSPPNPNLLPPT